MATVKIAVVTANYEEFRHKTFRGYVVNEVVLQDNATPSPSL